MQTESIRQQYYYYDRSALDNPGTVLLFRSLCLRLAAGLARRERTVEFAFPGSDLVRIGERSPGAKPGLDRFGELLSNGTHFAGFEPVTQHGAPVADMPAHLGDIGELVAFDTSPAATGLFST